MKISIDNVKAAIGAAELESLEQSIGSTLPAEYKAFMLGHNGGTPTPAYFRIQWADQECAGEDDGGKVKSFLSIYDGDAVNFLDYATTHEGRIPADTVAIATDPFENLILLGTIGPNEGKVFFWMRGYETEEDETADYSNVGLVANSFNEFLESLDEFEG